MVRGYVSCIKHGAAKDSIYFLINIDGQLRIDEFRGNLGAECGELLEYLPNGAVSQIPEGRGYLKAIEPRVSSLASELMDRTEYATGNRSLDAMTSKMWERLSGAGRLLIRKAAFSAPIIVRFHNDADGSSGACSLYLSLKDLCSKLGARPNAVWIMQKSVAYGPSDAENDILIANNYSSIERPLIVNIDFGTTIDSNMGLEAVNGRFDIIWLDHHPIAEGFEGVKLGNYINPWIFGGDSAYAAGMLTAAMCKTFSGVDTRRFEEASLVGDYSSYADRSKGSDTATLLDFITSDPTAIYGKTKANVTPQEIQALLDDKERSGEFLRYANMRLEEALDSGIKNLKVYSSEHSRIYVLDFSEIRSDDSKYPLPGRFASKLLDRITTPGNENVVLIVHAGHYISVRLSQGAGRHVDLLRIIGSIKGHYSKSIDAGGGHMYAAAIRVADVAEKKEIVKALIDRIR